MDIERWQRLSPLLDVLLELGPEARHARLELLRAQEPGLADELEKLLALEDSSDGFMEQPLLDKPGQPQAGNLVGPESYVKERIAAFREAGVTHLQVLPATADPAATVAQVKNWL